MVKGYTKKQKTFMKHFKTKKNIKYSKKKKCGNVTTGEPKNSVPYLLSGIAS